MLTMFARQIGVEAVASTFNEGVKAFQRVLARKMRQAANLVRDDARRKAEAVIRPRGLRRSAKPRVDSKGRRLGPLVRKIRARVKLSRSDVYAVIGPTRLAFYGRLLESGVDRDVTRKKKDGTNAKAYRFRLVARPHLEPAARVNAPKVTEIIGDTYDIFTKSGAVRGLEGGAGFGRLRDARFESLRDALPMAA